MSRKCWYIFKFANTLLLPHYWNIYYNPVKYTFVLLPWSGIWIFQKTARKINRKVIVKSVCKMWRHRGIRGITPLILNLVTRSRLVVSLKRRLHYLQWNRSWLTLNRGSVGPQPVWTFWRRQKLRELSRFKPDFADCPALRLVFIPSTLCWLPNKKYAQQKK
jgi:hypothetical protein